jgi:alpha-L-fucosidase
VVKEITVWMDVNKEGIFETRPCKKFGEGPVAEESNPINAQGFNEGNYKKFTIKVTTL